MCQAQEGGKEKNPLPDRALSVGPRTCLTKHQAEVRGSRRGWDQAGPSLPKGAGSLLGGGGTELGLETWEQHFNS